MSKERWRSACYLFLHELYLQQYWFISSNGNLAVQSAMNSIGSATGNICKRDLNALLRFTNRVNSLNSSTGRATRIPSVNPQSTV
ncbi:hypothetical protein D5086_014070 [Populus alba]|uniref:Uncharacterized protein n=1 Tax=Populus alba TaxID=43335 RepID=A0ACC4C7F4_POPAL